MKFRIVNDAMKRIALPLVWTSLGIAAAAGPFPPAAGVPGSDAVAADDPRLTLWAVAAEVERGPVEIEFPDGAVATFGSEEDAIGPADATPDEPYPVVSLGDGGMATLEFDPPFGDIPGPDFAVFENGFSIGFLELAHVEVSSDGEHFFRFPSVSLTPIPDEPASGGSVDATDVHNLAGKYLAGWGTPFDLAELRDISPLLDIQRITHVRVIDVIGINDPLLGSRDSLGNLIIDPYPTPFPSGGFDLDAVGAFSAATTTYAAWAASQGIPADQPAADSSGNGVPDLIEYLTGNGRLHAGPGVLRYRRLAYRGDAGLRVEGSVDLATWDTLAASTSGAASVAVKAGVSVTETGDAARQVQVDLPPDSEYRFFRLAAD